MQSSTIVARELTRLFHQIILFRPIHLSRSSSTIKRSSPYSELDSNRLREMTKRSSHWIWFGTLIIVSQGYNIQEMPVSIINKPDVVFANDKVTSRTH